MYSTMLELAISMILLYLMLSAASSAIQELIANKLRWRSETLENGIAGLLQNEEFKNSLYDLPLLKGLFGPNGRKPSYIPSSTFALAVLHLAEQQGMNLETDGGSPPLTTSSPQDPTEVLLQSLLRGAKEVEEKKKRIEDWFDNSMDRISGWYKRKSHAWLWVISITLCVLVNADSISLANAFWNDQTLRSATVAAATSYATSTQNQAQGQPFKSLDDVRKEMAKLNVPLGWCWGEPKKCFPVFNNPENAKAKPGENAPTGAGAPTGASAPTGTSAPTGASATSGSNPPNEAAFDPRMIVSFENGTDTALWWWWKIVGLAVTALAISQGAPFWFDLLQKAVNLRLSGAAPDESQKKK